MLRRLVRLECGFEHFPQLVEAVAVTIALPITTKMDRYLVRMGLLAILGDAKAGECTDEEVDDLVMACWGLRPCLGALRRVGLTHKAPIVTFKGLVNAVFDVLPSPEDRNALAEVSTLLAHCYIIVVKLLFHYCNFIVVSW
jgi:hypothetical protein